MRSRSELTVISRLPSLPMATTTAPAPGGGAVAGGEFGGRPSARARRARRRRRRNRRPRPRRPRRCRAGGARRCGSGAPSSRCAPRSARSRSRGAAAQALGELGAQLARRRAAAGRSRGRSPRRARRRCGRDSARVRARCRRCRSSRSISGGFASISEKSCTPGGQAGEEGVERDAAPRRGSPPRRCGAAAPARAGGRCRARARCARRAGGASRPSAPAAASGSAKTASGAGASAAGGVLHEERLGQRVHRLEPRRERRREARRVGAAEVDQPRKARSAVAGRRWVWASSSICSRCSSVRCAT